MGADGVSKFENRRPDMFRKGEAIEVKSGRGLVDKDQFEAYVQMVEQRTKIVHAGGKEPVTKLKYVFTDVEGAKANLPWLADKL